MKKALFITSYDRPDYLRETLASWESVRGLERWRVIARIEPSECSEELRGMFQSFFEKLNHPDFEIMVNPQCYGVLHHPWVGFEQLFRFHDFVVRAEDDLVVSDDILEFFEWASEAYRDDKQVATVHVFTHEEGVPEGTTLATGFSPWVWGTWRDRWRELLGPTWDHDYSTFNGFPGNQSGWDWNINTRLFPAQDLRSVAPCVSRSNNIGVTGVHGTADNFVTLPNFKFHYPQVNYQRVDTTSYE